jgi:hypothetical protein
MNLGVSVAEDISATYGLPSDQLIEQLSGVAESVMFKEPITRTTWNDIVKQAVRDTFEEPTSRRAVALGHADRTDQTNNTVTSYRNRQHALVDPKRPKDNCYGEGVRAARIPVVDIQRGYVDHRDSIVILPLDDVGIVMPPSANLYQPPRRPRPKGISAMLRAAVDIPPEPVDPRPVAGALIIGVSRVRHDSTYVIKSPTQVPDSETEIIQSLARGIKMRATTVEP